MIRNLNPITFQGFGSIMSERPQRSKWEDKSITLHLTRDTAPVYRAEADIWMTYGTGMSVLSVSRDGEQFRHFYLDKPLRIDAGVLFSLNPIQEKSTVLCCSDIPPTAVEVRSIGSFRVERRVRITGLYTFFYQEKEQGFLFPGESHPMPELTYVDQGSLHSVADGRDELLKQGDLIFYAPNQWHMQYSDVEVAPRFVTITFDAEGVGLENLYNRKITAPQEVLALLRRMLKEQEKMDEFSNDLIMDHLNILLLILLRDDKSPRAVKLQATNAIRSENEIIRRAQQYVSSHIREKLSVPMVARQVDVSPSYLTALFHKHLQISPGEYIRRIKLQESKQMIRENDLNFTEIAAELQYSTVHHFSRQFKEKFGLTPSEYAKSVR